MKSPLIAVIATACLVSAAHAQQTTPATPAPAPSTQPAPAARTTAPPTQEMKGPWHVYDFMRTNVYNMAGEKIGDVNDIILDENSKVSAIIIGVGGFLGIGEKQVAMTPDQVKRMVHSDGKTYFTVNATKEQLNAAPAYTKPKA